SDALDIQSAELTIKQRQNSLLDAREKLADYSVRAPFDGIIAELNLKKGDAASAGTALATFITKQKIAEISLNEVDAAKVKIGQKATLTFDALPDLTLTGQVAEIDAIGAISQGVVTYAVKIGFDTQDERVKTAMSVSASIITEAKTDVLLVPNSAVKSQDESSYVELPAETDIAAATSTANDVAFKEPLRRQAIIVGSTNDEFTEVISGLQENEVIVTRTIQATNNQTSATQSNSTFRIPGITGGGGFR
ncbi:MAG: HlyD family efflux transporter periplasmic adaptor subunit, partial [Patescibacteria group bacterium]